MLGHDTSFGYIHAVKMTHDEALPLKRTGYLADTLFRSDDHDLIILTVNTIQKDLKSDNYLVICVALNAVRKLISDETIPAVLLQVVELLGHSKETVRKKAIMAPHLLRLRDSAVWTSWRGSCWMVLAYTEMDSTQSVGYCVVLQEELMKLEGAAGATTASFLCIEFLIHRGHH